MSNNIVVTGGGTGGHLKVADAFIEELYKKEFNIIFIGSINGQDKLWFENDKRLYKKIFLDTKGVVNKKGLGKILSLFNILRKTIYCLGLYYKYDISKVISVGGFSAAPGTFASIFKPFTKLFIHEQNSKMGKLNEITSKFAKQVYSSFHDFSTIKDYPVSNEFFEKARIRSEIKTIAFFGGSQGAVAINDFALKLTPFLINLGIKVIHQTGKNDFERVKEFYSKNDLDVDVFDFSRNIIEKMREADFAISRAGASTLWEMSANCLPAYFVPYKYAAGNHQYFNAKDLVEKNMAFICEEDDLKEDEFLKLIDKIDINEISIRLKNSIKPNAVENIISDIIQK
ncbi:UDP-N-acetylglucosamine--N-acetylmuramyl-(pentapeptide) pyrophosphoryl-undecaprenol N-acetylglucosamine transferase [Arcobacter sp. YIC-80]|uniref:UDP-N-acetylglucosamine--N-acetylmuramyl- (pentapeptide) pyrophosphoryl-undecaprenol N-acetylglucosamine transferase n=1 Tax=Arcobacter sp. YIC-80 TaxID=3376683 RepID=UPI00384C34DB